MPSAHEQPDIIWPYIVAVTMHAATMHAATMHAVAMHAVTMHTEAMHAATMHAVAMHAVAMHAVTIFWLAWRITYHVMDKIHVTHPSKTWVWLVRHFKNYV